jgi:hypothetical protein
MYVMPEGCNVDASLHRDMNSYIGHLNTNNAHFSDQVGVRIGSPVNQLFCWYAHLACCPQYVNCGLGLWCHVVL